MKSIAAQLRNALRVKGWSIPVLLHESGLSCGRHSLLRKLAGTQKLSTEEAQALADALGCTLVWVPERGASS